MARQSTPIISSADESIAKSVLADWLGAAANFYNQYNKLMKLINNQLTAAQSRQRDMVYSASGPANKLISLSLTMRGELEKLVQDLDQLDCLNQYSTKQHYEKLIAHTLILNRLNRQAQTRIQSVSNPLAK